MNNDYLDYLEHDLFKKREKWKNHKYLYIDKNGRYVYPEDLKKEAKSKVQNVTSNIKNATANVKNTANKVATKSSKVANKKFDNAKQYISSKANEVSSAADKVEKKVSKKKEEVASLKKEVSSKISKMLTKTKSSVKEKVAENKKASSELDKQAGYYHRFVNEYEEEVKDLKRMGEDYDDEILFRRDGVTKRHAFYKEASKIGAKYYHVSRDLGEERQSKYLRDISYSAGQIDTAKEFVSGPTLRSAASIKNNMKRFEKATMEAENVYRKIPEEDREKIEWFYMTFEDYGGMAYRPLGLGTYGEYQMERLLRQWLKDYDEYGPSVAVSNLYDELEYKR